MHSYKITGGVPQGSVLGSSIWNVDSSLCRRYYSHGCCKKHRRCAIEIVEDWSSDLPNKKRVYATFIVNDEKIRTRDTMKYLEVTIDARMSFKDHLSSAGLKASKVARVLVGIMPNIRGPKQSRWLLLSSVVHSVILYGAPISADALCSNPSYGAACQRTCRIIALSGLYLPYGIRHCSLDSRQTAIRRPNGEGMIEEEDDFYHGQRRNRWSRKTGKSGSADEI